MISIGIDAAKGKSTVCILKPYGEVVVPPRDVSHTASELESLIFLIKSLGESVKAVMESTGTYHYPVLHALVDADIFVAVENHLVIKSTFRRISENEKPTRWMPLNWHNTGWRNG